MGNSLSHAPSAKAFDSINSDLMNIYYSQQLGDGWFLKTAKCSHSEGPVVVKIFSKEHLDGDSRDTDNLLQAHTKKLQEIRYRLTHSLNNCPFQRFIEGNDRIYLIRQYFYNNLRDRVETRPCLTQTEKIWITFLLLKALDECHSNDICHGDLKLENVMLTSWNWVYLTDYACYKPTCISSEIPHSFSYYFDTHRSRSCYLAPERFKGTSEITGDEQLTPEMDIFSLGCLIADLFLDTATFMNLGELLRYKGKNNEERYEPTAKLQRIQQKSVRKLIQRMISLDPSKRGSAAEYLQNWEKSGFPSYFETLYNKTLQLMSYNSDDKILTIKNEFEHLKKLLRYRERPDTPDRSGFTRKATFNDTESYILTVAKPRSIDLTTSLLGSSTFFEENEIPNSPLSSPGSNYCPGMAILLSVVCSSLHDIQSESIKEDAIALFVKLGSLLDDRCRLQRIVPFLISLFRDQNPSIISSAIIALITILKQVNTFPPSDIKIFPEYILPALIALIENGKPDPLVLSTLAKYLADFATVSRTFLTASESLSQSILLSHGTNSVLGKGNEITSLRAQFITIINTLSEENDSFTKLQTSNIRCGLLENIDALVKFLGPQVTFDSLVKHVFTFISIGPTWEVRCKAFEGLPSICKPLGSTITEQVLFPLLLQGIYDPEEMVINGVLQTLYQICNLEYSFLELPSLFSIITAVCPLLLHPTLSIRKNTVNLIVAITNNSNISDGDIWSFIIPKLNPYLKETIVDFNEEILFDTLHSPIPNSMYLNVIKYCRSLVTFADLRASQKDQLKRQEDVKILIHEFIKTKSNDLSDEDKYHLLLIAPFVTGSISLFPIDIRPELIESKIHPEHYEELIAPPKNTKIPSLTDIGHLSNSKLLVYLGAVVPKTISERDISRSFKGKLVTSVSEHLASVTHLGVLSDSTYFISASIDGCIKVWNSSRLNDMRSVCTKVHPSPITALYVIPNTFSFLVGERDGTVSCLRIDADIESASLDVVCEFGLKGKVIEFSKLNENQQFLAVTSIGFYILDLNESKPCAFYPSPVEHGSICCFIHNPKRKWGVAGTSKGIYSCWDLRLVIEIKHWRQPHSNSNNLINPAIMKLCIDTRKDTPAFFSSTANSEIYRWDITTETYLLVFHSNHTLWKLPKEIPDFNCNEYLSMINNLDKVPERSNHLSFCLIPQTGILLTGSTDGCIREWNTRTPEKSRILCGWRNPIQKPIYDVSEFNLDKNINISLTQEYKQDRTSQVSILSNPGHRDAVTDIKLCFAHSIPILISSSRDGKITIWK